MKQPGFFDVKERLASLRKLADQLEVFRSDLDKAPAYSDRRPPFDSVLRPEILVIQTLNDLSSGRTKYLINDCLSVLHAFLGVGAGTVGSRARC